MNSGPSLSQPQSLSLESFASEQKARLPQFTRTRSLNAQNMQTGFNFYSDQLKEGSDTPAAYNRATGQSMLGDNSTMRPGMGS